MKSPHVSWQAHPPARVPEHPSYCPACLALIDASAAVCPACGKDLVHLSERAYRDKLLAALNHPLADVRLRAIIALGWRGEGEAALALAQCALHHPTDIVEGLQVIESLLHLGDKEARREALRQLAVRHPARVVRLRAAASSADDS
jgi:HEAT repeat protein